MCEVGLGGNNGLCTFLSKFWGIGGYAHPRKCFVIRPSMVASGLVAEISLYVDLKLRGKFPSTLCCMNSSILHVCSQYL